MADDKVKGYKNFANKVWNITRFILESTKGTEHQKDFTAFTESDEKLLAEQREFLSDITKDMEGYRFYMASEKIYHYIWNTLADIILEDSKKVFNTGTDEEKTSRKQFLLSTLRTLPLSASSIHAVRHRRDLAITAGCKRSLDGRRVANEKIICGTHLS